ncbi:alpha/beta-Hydrolases superfamily protein [Rhynchospora pubera]|uniref:Alpha/beta-Hydrolases superfamily protein n=1 Tax=Rhynchospora pubera TaxID=906938 RepID=A0AAV8D2N0_9POAL|nr:alpha/beta-Hydrolases superfamily protein [Rhynchospora pubera]
MNPDKEVEFDFPPVIRFYKSGRFERLSELFVDVPAGFDSETEVSSKDVIINPSTGVSARIYLPNILQSTKLPIIVYCHGGAFVEGSAFDSFNHSFMNRLSAQAGAIAVSVEYRLAPENPIPIPYDDSFEVLNWVVSHAQGGPEPWLVNNGDFDNVFLVGFSAGANIVHNIALRDVHFKGLVVMHPFFLASEKLPSEPTDPKLRDGIERLWSYICPGTSGIDDPAINPLAEGAPDLKGLNCERVMVCSDEGELKVRGDVYYEHLVKCGWGENVEFVESQGEQHGFFLEKPDCEKAQEMMSRLVAFIKSA